MWRRGAQQGTPETIFKWTLGVEITFRNNLLTNWKWKLLKIIYQRRDALGGAHCVAECRTPCRYCSHSHWMGMWQFPYYVREVPKSERIWKKVMPNSASRQTKQMNNSMKNKSVSNLSNTSSERYRCLVCWISHMTINWTFTRLPARLQCCPTCLQAFDFSRMCFFSNSVLVGRRDKNHHCRCSHGCFARTLILHANT